MDSTGSIKRMKNGTDEGMGQSLRRYLISGYPRCMSKIRICNQVLKDHPPLVFGVYIPIHDLSKVNCPIISLNVGQANTAAQFCKTSFVKLIQAGLLPQRNERQTDLYCVKNSGGRWIGSV